METFETRILWIVMWCCVVQLLPTTLQQPSEHEGEFEEFGYLEGEPESEIVCSFERLGTRLCDCGYGNERKYLPRMFGSVGEVHTINCKYLHVKRDTFVDVNDLQRLTFVNIEELVLDDNAFSVRTGRHLRALDFTNVRVEEIPTHFLNGSTIEMNWENCRIGVLKPFIMINTGTRFQTLRISNSWIHKVDPQAFKKIQVENFEITNTSFSESIPSRSFYDLEITERFRITDSAFNHIHASAFVLKDVKRFELTNNQFGRINGDAFIMPVTGDVWIKNNDFKILHPSAFGQITVNPTYKTRNIQKLVLYMTSNRIESIEDTFNLILSPDFDVKIIDLRVMNFILCYQVMDISDRILLENSQNVRLRIKDVSMPGDFVDLGSALGGLCNNSTNLTYVIVGASVGLLLLLLLVIGLGLFCYCRRKKKFEIVMPEGKTYRETQIIMQIENHGLLKTDL